MSDEARSAIPAMPAVLGLAGCLPDLGAWNADREGQGRHGAGAARASTGRHVENRVGCSLQASACRGVTAGPSSPPPFGRTQRHQLHQLGRLHASLRELHAVHVLRSGTKVPKVNHQRSLPHIHQLLHGFRSGAGGPVRRQRRHVDAHRLTFL